MTAKTIRTHDYSQFIPLASNRHISKAHIKNLKASIEEKPSMSEYRPILVNENKEIIDGQHRFAALQELGYPVYYVEAPGLNIDDARKLNIGQRNWTEVDYAQSYADSGDKDYETYLFARESYRLPHNVMVAYLTGNNATHTAAFRNGSFKIPNMDIAQLRFERLSDLGIARPQDWRRKQFGLAFLTLMTNPKYDHDLFLHKMKAHGDRFLAKFEVMQDYQRAFEKIYNAHTPVNKQIKLF